MNFSNAAALAAPSSIASQIQRRFLRLIRVSSARSARSIICSALKRGRRIIGHPDSSIGLQWIAVRGSE